MDAWCLKVNQEPKELIRQKKTTEVQNFLESNVKVKPPVNLQHQQQVEEPPPVKTRSSITKFIHEYTFKRTGIIEQVFEAKKALLKQVIEEKKA